MTVLSLRFCARAFSSCGKWRPLFIVVRGPLTIAASLVAEHRLQTCRLSNCGSWAQLLRGMWDLPRPGLEPVSPALAGRFSTTAPPGKPDVFIIYSSFNPAASLWPLCLCTCGLVLLTVTDLPHLLLLHPSHSEQINSHLFHLDINVDSTSSRKLKDFPFFFSHTLYFIFTGDK